MLSFQAESLSSVYPWFLSISCYLQADWLVITLATLNMLSKRASLVGSPHPTSPGRHCLPGDLNVPGSEDIHGQVTAVSLGKVLGDPFPTLLSTAPSCRQCAWVCKPSTPLQLPYRHQKAEPMLEIRRFRVRGSRLDFPHMLTCERSSPEQTS